MQESRHAQDEEKEDQTRHEDPLAAHHHHLRDGRHASCPSDGRWRETGAGNRVASQMKGYLFKHHTTQIHNDDADLLADP